MATILVIEDEANIARAIKDRLAKDGHEVVSQPSGPAALVHLQQHRPDLIILDMLMPDMDGFEVVGHLRANPVNTKIPIIILSVLADDERIKQLGAAAVLSKPYRGADLIRAVHDALASGGEPHGPEENSRR